jgi:hypothetical protein
VYNITTAPKVIEEGATALMELIYYLAADGYKIKTPIFTLYITIPGVYDGTETRLPEGVAPRGRLKVALALQKYLAERVQLQVDGVDENRGIIAEAIDRATGDVNQTICPGALLELRGAGLKIATDARHTDDVGIFLEDAADGSRVKISPPDIAVNTPRHLDAVAPPVSAIPAGKQYYVVVRTQASTKAHGGLLLKEVREVKSDFTLTSLPANTPSGAEGDAPPAQRGVPL